MQPDHGPADPVHRGRYGAVEVGVAGNSGQNCVAGTRLLVQRAVYDEVVAAVSEQLSRAEVGDPFDQAHLERVRGYVDVGPAEGAKPHCGGTDPYGPPLDSGYHFAPTLPAADSDTLRISREEIFGPVLTVLPFEDAADAVAIGNDTARRVSGGLRAGVVRINMYGVNDPAVPFGGWKQSGHGREGGDEVIELYTEVDGLVDDVLFGTVWGDETLALRDRQLRTRLQAALRLGLTEEQITAALTHLAFYAGVPAAYSAPAVAEEVFESNRKPSPPGSGSV